jgi:hypothetical protein
MLRAPTHRSLLVEAASFARRLSQQICTTQEKDVDDFIHRKIQIFTQEKQLIDCLASLVVTIAFVSGINPNDALKRSAN